MKKTFIVAHYTLREFLKGKVFIGTLFLSAGLLFMTILAKELTYKTVLRIIVDIGFGLSTISSIFLAIFLGINLLISEIENRTIYIPLSQPITRTQFFWGKILGLTAMMWINVVILSSQTIIYYYFSGGELNSLFAWVVAFLILECLIVMVVTVGFSLITNRYLAVFCSIALYVMGHAMDTALQSKMLERMPSFGQILRVADVILPMYYKLNFKDFLIYEQTILSATLRDSMVYGSLYFFAISCLCLFIFNQRDFN